MSQKLPAVTVLIPARAGQTDVRSVAAARNLNYPAELLEIIVARGAQPSAQRNAGICLAKGELIYFLDDDSLPDRDNLNRAVARFEAPDVAMVGGPNICPPDAPGLEQVFAVALTAWLAFGPSRARYAPVGEVRPSSEKELILCNLLARRKSVLDLGGFNEALYPNEENALMDQLQSGGQKLLYDPDLVVYRRPRPNLKAFRKMLMTYGRGRAEQFRVNPTPGSALNFLPPLFCLYLVSLPFVAVLGWIWLVPLALYLLAILAQGLILMRHGGFRRGIAATPLVVLTHILYGVGFWRGLFTSLRKPSDTGKIPVTLEKLQ